MYYYISHLSYQFIISFYQRRRYKT